MVVAPAQVVENNSTKILCNISIQTDHEVINKKPDITVMDKSTKQPTSLKSLSQMTTISAMNISKKYEHMEIRQVKLRHSGI